jgi:hypothetical protein
MGFAFGMEIMMNARQQNAQLLNEILNRLDARDALDECDGFVECTLQFRRQAAFSARHGQDFEHLSLLSLGCSERT